MTAVETVQLHAATESDADDSQLNPVVTEPGAEIHITLVFPNGSLTGISGATIFDMVDAQFGTVAANKVAARNCYEFICT